MPPLPSVTSTFRRVPPIRCARACDWCDWCVHANMPPSEGRHDPHRGSLTHAPACTHTNRRGQRADLVGIAVSIHILAAAMLFIVFPVAVVDGAVWPRVFALALHTPISSSSAPKDAAFLRLALPRTLTYMMPHAACSHRLTQRQCAREREREGGMHLFLVVDPLAVINIAIGTFGDTTPVLKPLSHASVHACSHARAFFSADAHACASHRQQTPSILPPCTLHQPRSTQTECGSGREGRVGRARGRERRGGRDFMPHAIIGAALVACGKVASPVLLSLHPLALIPACVRACGRDVGIVLAHLCVRVNVTFSNKCTPPPPSAHAPTDRQTHVETHTQEEGGRDRRPSEQVSTPRPCWIPPHHVPVYTLPLGHSHLPYTIHTHHQHSAYESGAERDLFLRASAG